MWPVTVTSGAVARSARRRFAGLSRLASGPAASAIARLTGTRITTVQVSSADDVCRDLGRGGRLGGRPLRRPGQDRHHDAGQRAAEDDVVDDVRQRVGGHVRGAEAGGADGLGEHDGADQAEQPGEHRQPRDQRGGAADACAGRPPSAGILAVLRDRDGRAGHRASAERRSRCASAGGLARPAPAAAAASVGTAASGRATVAALPVRPIGAGTAARAGGRACPAGAAVRCAR